MSASFAERSPVPRRSHWPRVAAVALAVSALVAATVSAPGRAVLDEIREVVGVERAQPALFSLPAPSRLLVSSDQGVWVVQEDGSRRLLGDYREATWSPFGRFVAATRENSSPRSSRTATCGGRSHDQLSVHLDGPEPRPIRVSHMSIAPDSGSSPVTAQTTDCWSPVPKVRSPGAQARIFTSRTPTGAVESSSSMPTPVRCSGARTATDVWSSSNGRRTDGVSSLVARARATTSRSTRRKARCSPVSVHLAERSPQPQRVPARTLVRSRWSRTVNRDSSCQTCPGQHSQVLVRSKI